MLSSSLNMWQPLHRPTSMQDPKHSSVFMIFSAKKWEKILYEGVTSGEGESLVINQSINTNASLLWSLMSMAGNSRWVVQHLLVRSCVWSIYLGHHLLKMAQRDDLLIEFTCAHHCSEWHQVTINGVTLPEALKCWEDGRQESNHYERSPRRRGHLADRFIHRLITGWVYTLGRDAPSWQPHSMHPYT